MRAIIPVLVCALIVIGIAYLLRDLIDQLPLWLAGAIGIGSGILVIIAGAAIDKLLD